MDTSQTRMFLEELAKTQGKADTKKAGQALNLDSSTIEEITIHLISEGVLEMVSLSGQVRITPAGHELLRGGLQDFGKDDLPNLLIDLDTFSASDLSADQANDFNLDIQCLKDQVRRSIPLDQVVKACLKEIYATLDNSSAKDASKLKELVKGYLASL